MSVSYKCPHCKIEEKYAQSSEFEYSNSIIFPVRKKKGRERHYEIKNIVRFCSKCGKDSIDIWMKEIYHDILKRPSNSVPDDFVISKRIWPESEANDYLEYISKELQYFYAEAHKLRTISPTASAILSRKCLEGLINEIWKVKEKTLAASINQIAKNLDSLTLSVIKKAKEYGNIAAHFDTSGTDPILTDEQTSKKMVKLIESLINQWLIEPKKKEEELRNF